MTSFATINGVSDAQTTMTTMKQYNGQPVEHIFNPYLTLMMD